MDSYMEVTFINTLLLLWLSTSISCYITWKPLARKKLFLYAITIAFVGSFLFARYEWMIMVLLEAFFFFWLWRYALKTWLVLIALRLLWNMTCYVLYQGSFHLGIYFVPSHVRPLPLWLFCLVTIIFLQHKWKDSLGQLDFIYPCAIDTCGIRIKLHGYLDSGNLLTYNNIPVIFLDLKYAEYFKDECIELVVMDTIEKADMIPCYEASITLGRLAKRRVLINCEQHLRLPYHAQALLNMNMMI